MDESSCEHTLTYGRRAKGSIDLVGCNRVCGYIFYLVFAFERHDCNFKRANEEEMGKTRKTGRSGGRTAFVSGECWQFSSKEEE